MAKKAIKTAYFRGGGIGRPDKVLVPSAACFKHLEVNGLDPRFKVCFYGCGYAYMDANTATVAA